jgi:hypothetical protein
MFKFDMITLYLNASAFKPFYTNFLFQREIGREREREGEERGRERERERERRENDTMSN